MEKNSEILENFAMVLYKVLDKDDLTRPIIEQHRTYVLTGGMKNTVFTRLKVRQF